MASKPKAKGAGASTSSKLRDGSPPRSGDDGTSPIPYPRFNMSKRSEWTKSLYSKEGESKQEGIKITREEVEAAFNFFDVSGKGILRPKDLKARLSAFYPNMTNKEYRFLISEPNFTVDTLWNLLQNNNITNFDPVREAFKVYDPNDTGFVDPEVLKQIMSRMGYGEMTKEDMDVLIKTADVDNDGKISLEDFRNMLNFNKYSKDGKDGGLPAASAEGTSGDEADSDEDEE
eukprot:NODE_606_length_1330_cov_73.290108_g567_i0.p1 GENE.NODE_606_length_1330_cov_73.290108_g567_i0~~NODE_606_length_1330_cov_73.290108_g567_i0.p1  ORF type:complete len:231 (-),score=39.03 NODE_606_length_1330_cov_73.290108_g567_i0:532-1224(-)